MVDTGEAEKSLSEGTAVTVAIYTTSATMNPENKDSKDTGIGTCPAIFSILSPI
jgi:hypothetical protein